MAEKSYAELNQKPYSAFGMKRQNEMYEKAVIDQIAATYQPDKLQRLYNEVYMHQILENQKMDALEQEFKDRAEKFGYEMDWNPKGITKPVGGFKYSIIPSVKAKQMVDNQNLVTYLAKIPTMPIPDVIKTYKNLLISADSSGAIPDAKILFAINDRIVNFSKGLEDEKLSIYLNALKIRTSFSSNKSVRKRQIAESLEQMRVAESCPEIFTAGLESKETPRDRLARYQKEMDWLEANGMGKTGLAKTLESAIKECLIEDETLQAQGHKTSKWNKMQKEARAESEARNKKFEEREAKRQADRDSADAAYERNERDYGAM